MKLFILKSTLLLLILLCGLSITGKAQTYTVKGSVLDSAGLPIPGAIVRVKWAADSLAMSSATDGSFSFNQVKAPQFSVSAAFIGFKTFIKQYQITQGNSIVLPAIKLSPAANTLDLVVVTAVPPVKISEDTVSFNAASFPVRQGDAVDEVLRKLPGIKVDQDGNVTNQGEPVTKIRVNGKDFFGTDVATAIKNLPADIIKNLQFIDDYGDQARLTGVKTGEPQKILNLTIQEDKKKGYFVRASGGLGNEERYNTSLRANSMKGERQLSFDGTLNNANMRGRGGDGITTRNAAGLNYRNEWGPKLSADASYNFENRNNNTQSTAYTQNLLQDFTRFEDERNNNISDRYNHNFSGNIEYKRDTMNYLKVSPELSYNSNSANNNGLSTILQQDISTRRNSLSLNNSSSLNFRTNVFYNHRFAKKGRNLNVRGNINYNIGEDFRDVANEYVITEQAIDSLRLQNQLTDQQNDRFETSAGLSYMEPLWTKSFIEFNYGWSRTTNSSIRDTRDVIEGQEVFNVDLSNNYDYQFITNRIGLNYRYINEKYNYTLGFNAQPAVLKGQNLSKDINTLQRTFNLIPSARFVYKFSRQESFDMNYYGRNNQPGFLQLQPIADNSNLQNVVIGNPNLKPEFIHSINAHYRQSDWNMGHVLYANVSYNQTQNRIVTTKVLIPNTANQVTSYTNTNGFYTLNGDYSYSKPFSDRKFTIGYSGGGALSNNVAFIDNNKNIAKNTVWRQELEFEIDIKDVVDVELEAEYSVNKTSYSQSAFEDRQTNRFEYGINGRNYFFKDLTLGYDLSKTINSGFDNSFVNNPTILRLFMEYRFLKGNMATIRLDGFDLFNENNGISRDVFDNVIIDRQVNRLGRYFMLSFIFNVRRFGV